MRFSFIAVLLVALAAAPASLLAHHSTALYDKESPITIAGVVTRFDWSNPHAYIYLDVKDTAGRVEEWTIEMTSLRLLKSFGWTRGLIKPGDTIHCTGGRAKDGRPAMLGFTVRLPDGHEIRTL